MDKHLSADGINYFIDVLDKRTFTNYSWPRNFANYLTEWPLVLAVKSGMRDIPAMINLFALGIFFPYLLSFAVCTYVLRDEDRALMIFFLASIASIDLTSDYVLISEHHVMTAMSWPILFLLLRSRPLTWPDGLLLWVLLIIFSRLYESAIMPALIYAALCLARLYCHRQKEPRIITGGALLLCLAVFSIALYSILNPRDPANRASFINSITEVLENRAVLAAAVFLALYNAGLFLRNRAIIIFALLPLLMYVFIIFFYDYSVSAVESFSGRTLSLTLLPFLLVGAVLMSYFKIKPDWTARLVFILFILVMAAGSLQSLKNWNSFRTQATEIVGTHRGYVQIEETALKDSPYGWTWNNAQLGLVWSAPCVKAILLNQRDVKWEPFDPREKLVLKRYLQYDDAFRGMDKNIRSCGATAREMN
jgi:hypothetical protein